MNVRWPSLAFPLVRTLRQARPPAQKPLPLRIGLIGVTLFVAWSCA